MAETNLKVSVSEAECLVHIRGSIDENTQFSAIETQGIKTLVIDLKEVTLLNSMGLRNWVRWVKAWRGKGRMVLRHCPRGVVDQMNILQGFLPLGALVESFYVPYFCESCETEENVLATRGRDFIEGTVDTKEGFTLELSKTCSKCGKVAEMDVVPAKYFGFLKYRSR